MHAPTQRDKRQRPVPLPLLGVRLWGGRARILPPAVALAKPHRHGGHLDGLCRRSIFGHLGLVLGVLLLTIETAAILLAVVEAVVQGVVVSLFTLAAVRNHGPMRELDGTAASHARLHLREHAVDDAHVVPNWVEDGLRHPGSDDAVVVRLEHKV